MYNILPAVEYFSSVQSRHNLMLVVIKKKKQFRKSVCFGTYGFKFISVKKMGLDGAGHISLCIL